MCIVQPVVNSVLMSHTELLQCEGGGELVLSGAAAAVVVEVVAQACVWGKRRALTPPHSSLHPPSSPFRPLHASQFFILPPASPFPILVLYAHLAQELLTQLGHKDDFVTEIPVLSKTSLLDMGTIYTYTETKLVPFVRALCS